MIHADDPVLAALLAKFADAPACWMSSVRPDGRVHLAPIWHVWHAGCAYVCTQSGSVRAANIAQNSSVSLALPDPMNVIIIEGEAGPAPEDAAALQPLFQAKFDWNISTDADYTLILRITPRKIMAWGDHGEGRWHFA
ncbi:MAG: pyridoxamine 5'-phosphate oxidase family protein [Caldilineaceae bacterium]|nr:pyridoxamine 5'-phosphate oxidase family protein [Caldilineaceae bacterium]